MSIQYIGRSVYMIDAPFHGVSGVLGTCVVKGESSMVIDPGPTAIIPYIITGLEELGVLPDSLKWISTTHIHLDHACGSWQLLENYPSSMLYVHPKGSRHMINPEKLEVAARGLFGDAVDAYGEIRGVPPERVVESKDGEELDLGGVSVQVLWTPGHSSHHQSYFVPEDEVLIVGDAGGFHDSHTGMIMPTTPPPFNPHKAVESLDRLIALEPRYICYGHFGFACDAVEKLEVHRRQILLWSRLVEEGMEEGLSLRDIYARIRAEDPMAMHAEVFKEDRRERSSLINLIGFVKYFEWIKEEEGKM
jgi:glyoxylase-like metal-dependent hydrolase (beta-lactamase superfamily II)